MDATKQAAGSWLEPTRIQIEQLTYGIEQRLGKNLVGIYLHGSLAMGCFNPNTSDIDLLVVISRGLTFETKKSLLELLVLNSGQPNHPVEISFIRQSDLVPWQYLTPFELHFSEVQRWSLSQVLAAAPVKDLAEQRQTDPDLAAHVTVTRERGIALLGKSIGVVFPTVPRQVFLDSIISDLRWAREKVGQNSGLVYAVLNSCRVCVYLQDGRACSKEEGAIWALNRLPVEFHPIIRGALEVYRGKSIGNNIADPGTAERLIDYVLARAMS